MAETKFTQGPLVRGASEFTIYAGAKLVAHAHWGHGVNGEVARANARLMTAAPDMYQALESARDYVEADLQQRREAYRGYENLGHIHQVERELNAIDAALAKARGEAV